MRMPSATSATSSPPKALCRELSVQVEGEVETRDTQGIVRGAVERFPPRLYLRETPLTSADAAIAEFAVAARDAAKGDVLGTLHTMLDRLHEEITFDTGSTTTHDIRPRRRSRSSEGFARTSLTSSSRARAASAFRRAMSAATFCAVTA